MVQIPPLEGVVVQATLEEFAVLTVVFLLIELDLIPGEKADKEWRRRLMLFP